MKGLVKTATVITAVLLFVLGLTTIPMGQASSAASGLPLVHPQGGDLAVAGQGPRSAKRFQAWGFNYGVGDRYRILDYFDRPSNRRLQRVVADMREARALGANTLRVYLELGAFMKGPSEPNSRTLDALAALLEGAERLHLYLDITGNLVWRAPPAWYDALGERDRWRVQACFLASRRSDGAELLGSARL